MEPLSPDPESRSDGSRPGPWSRQGRWWFKHGRFLRGVLVGVALTLLAGLGLGGLVWSRARSAGCDTLPREDLSLREMGQLRRRMDAYKGDPDLPLTLSGREASFLVREQFELPAWLAIEGTQVHLEARLPEEGGRCWNVGFRGRVEVEEGVAHVVPTSFTVGELDLGWFVRGRRFEVPDALLASSGPGAAELARHLVSMQIADGTMFVRVDDPGWIE